MPGRAGSPVAVRHFAVSATTFKEKCMVDYLLAQATNTLDKLA